MAIFVAVAEQGGFNTAARRLGLSPAAVTRAVAAVEARLGARLLERTTRSVRPTEAGARFLEHARRLLAEVDAAERDAAGLHEAPRGELAVTAPVVFGRLHVLPVVLDFLDRWPEVTARLALLDRTVSLVEEGFDVAVRIGRLPDSSLIGARVGVDPPDRLREPGLPRGARDACDTRRLEVAPLRRLHRHDSHAGVGLRRHLGPRPPEPGRRQRRGRGRRGARGPRDHLRAGVPGRGRPAGRPADGDLRDFEPEPRPVHLLHPAGRPPPAKVRAFLDAAVPRLREALAAEADLPAPPCGTTCENV
jgi:DNA-binding transcriptional LysR family regulator